MSVLRVTDIRWIIRCHAKVRSGCADRQEMDRLMQQPYIWLMLQNSEAEPQELSMHDKKYTIAPFTEDDAPAACAVPEQFKVSSVVMRWCPR